MRTTKYKPTIKSMSRGEHMTILEASDYEFFPLLESINDYFELTTKGMMAEHKQDDEPGIIRLENEMGEFLFIKTENKTIIIIATIQQPKLTQYLTDCVEI